MATGVKFTLRFKREKQTTNTWRYQEVGPKDEVIDKDELVVGPLYLKKSALGTDVPEHLKVVIEVA